MIILSKVAKKAHTGEIGSPPKAHGKTYCEGCGKTAKTLACTWTQVSFVVWICRSCVDTYRKSYHVIGTK